MKPSMRLALHSMLIAAACCTRSLLASDGQCVVLTAKPRFEPRGECVHLIVSNASQSIDISWAMPPEVQFVPVSLDTNRVYTFTVEQKPYRNIMIPNLRRVESEGQILYDLEVCEVHKVKMELKEVTIAHGFPAPHPDAPSPGTERQLFPHRREDSVGGCAIAPNSPKTKEVYVCSKCKEAFEWWSGTATAPYSVLPRDTRYDSDPHLRLVYLEAYGKGYVAAWARKESLPVFGPTREDDKARLFGYVDGAAAGRIARDSWSGASGERYGPTNSTSQRR